MSRTSWDRCEASGPDGGSEAAFGIGAAKKAGRARVPVATAGCYFNRSRYIRSELIHMWAPMLAAYPSAIAQDHFRCSKNV